MKFILIPIFLFFLSGCGGNSDNKAQNENQDQYGESQEQYHNVDGSPPQCIILSNSGVQVCNTDPEIVSVSRDVINGTITMDDAYIAIRRTCLLQGLNMGVCGRAAGEIIQLIFHNLTNGLPQ